MAFTRRKIAPVDRPTGFSDYLFFFLVYFIAAVAFVITLYPFVYVLSNSMSNAKRVAAGDVWLWPVQFDFAGYKEVLTDENIWVAYGNTFFYVIVGTIVNMIFTCMCAYPLSRRTFFARRFLNFFISFTMYFGGGLIPTYLLITKMGLYNNRLVMIIPGLVSTYNCMICRSAFSAIPEEVMESASIDGANDMQILVHIAIRLIVPTLAVLVLYYAVGHWNAYFNALLYLSKAELQPLQVLLRRVLIQSSSELLTGSNMNMTDDETKVMISLQIRYVVIIVATLPILCLYPFVQKYFVKGVMLGAVKG